MNFEKHLNLKGKHAYLSASKYHWINYDEDRLVEWFTNQMAIERGTKLHEFAASAIELGQKIKGRSTLAMYVNDAIGYKMIPEQPLYYSDNCFGTADSIIFRDNLLRIHDLKTGATPAHMEQLFVYVALFCLEYKYKPSEIDIETRIYQNNEIWIENPTVEDIVPIMDSIITFDKIINKIREREGM